MSILRNRIHYLFLIIGTIGLGLASRAGFIPQGIYPYLGDVLYALMIYFLIGFLLRRVPSLTAAALCVAICYSIELSQLYQAAWINEIRSTRLGGLMLGFGFLWSDLVCYLTGALIGVGLEYIFIKKA
ncbi:MAG: DUF2809 domain-containing protein [Bacteroidetes bacterium]|nr:DUF2809 domain-containing protein [Bacteroidota bacterium]